MASTDTERLEGHETGLSELGEWSRILPSWGAQGKFSQCSGVLRLGTVLQSHSSGLLIHRSAYSHVCSGLEVEMEFGEVKTGVRVYWHQMLESGAGCRPI